MDIKKFSLVVVLFVACFSLSAQNKYDKWAIGVGGSFSVFPKNSTALVGEGFSFHIPGASLTRYIKDGFSVGGDFYASGINEIKGVYENKHKVMSFGLFGRYDFKQSNKEFVPYVTAGASMLVKDLVGKAISLNFGGGATYWIFPRVGLNAQIGYRFVPSVYKNTFDSHPHVAGAIVFAIGEKSTLRTRGGSGFCSY
jgi:hypothetical protein